MPQHRLACSFPKRRVRARGVVNPTGSFGGFIEILYYIGFTEAEITGMFPIHVGLAFGIGQ